MPMAAMAATGARSMKLSFLASGMNNVAMVVYGRRVPCITSCEIGGFRSRDVDRR